MKKTGIGKQALAVKYAKEYMELCEKKNEKPRTQKEFQLFIQKQLGKNPDFIKEPLIHTSTVSKVLRAAGIYKYEGDNGIESNCYDYNPACNSRADSLRLNAIDMDIELLKYNKTLCLHINPDFSALVASTLNQVFYSIYFYCYACHDLIICHYYYRKKEDKYEVGVDFYSKAYIKKEISTLLGISL